MRLFLAVFPPAAVQEAADAVIESLRRPGDGISWVKRENLHYTMRFLGEVGEDGARRAAEAALEAVAGARAFGAVLGSLGAFPNPRRARVLWIGMSEGAEPLVSLARALEQALRGRGFDRADKPFAAHLTIGRVRDRDQDWGDRVVAAKPLGARFTVGTLQVIESTLSPKGSIYRVRAEAPLVG